MIRLVLLAIMTLVAGAVYEGACVGWVHFSERGKPIATSLFSMLAALAEVTGVFNSVHDWRIAPFFVLGYGTGTYIAVTLKNKRTNRSPDHG